MDVLNQILKESAVGPFTAWIRSLAVSLFAAIVLLLAGMLVVLLLHGSHLNITFGY